MKSSRDPAASMHLHGLEFLHGAFKPATLIVPQLCPIHCNQKDAHMVEKPLVLGTESTDRVTPKY